MHFVMAALAIGGCALLGGCATPDILPRGAQAYQRMGNPDTDLPQVLEYHIGALDTISVNVFQEPDLSLKDTAVEASGVIALPLIGSVRAAGRTTSELSAEIAHRYAVYLTRPQVAVTVTTAVSQQVTVEGNVILPGSYPVSGSMTLLRALALAHGPTRVAALDEVVVFRIVDGKRMGALFDVNAIRKGQASDPLILGNDMVVVGFSSVKGAYRDILQTAPLVSVFRNF